MSADTPQSGTFYPLTWLNRLSSRAEDRRSRAAPDGLVGSLERGPDGALTQEAFHYLLAVERARASRAGHPLPLLLVGQRREPRKAAPMKPADARRLLAGLGEAVRDTDLVGWYRDGRVVGAVLLEQGAAPAVDGHPGLVQRVRELLHRNLPPQVTRSLEVRLVNLPTKPRRRDKR